MFTIGTGTLFGAGKESHEKRVIWTGINASKSLG
jgi:hypothetical protein